MRSLMRRGNWSESLAELWGISNRRVTVKAYPEGAESVSDRACYTGAVMQTAVGV